MGACLSSFSKDYEVKQDRILGSGQNGYVMEAIHHTTGEACAVKILRNKDFAARSEVNANIRLQHPHIAKLLQVYEDRSALTMVMERCGDDLFDRLDKKGRFSEPEARRNLRQVLLAVAYIHEQGFVHTDLKLENILFSSDADDADIRLIDLGFCQSCSVDEVLTNKLGSPGYMAPEVIQGRYTNKCDLFSLGVVAYLLLSDSAPFGLGDPQKCEPKVLKGTYEFGRRFNGVSSLAKDFIAGLLVVDPTQRMSAHQALQHPWLQSLGHGYDRMSKQQVSYIDLDRVSSEASTRVPSITVSSSLTQ
jgi:calcium-dependent protein kinase